MMRFIKMTVLALSTMVLFASLSMAAPKGGHSSSSSGRSSGASSAKFSKGPVFNVLPTTSTTKVINTRVTPTKVTMVDPKTGMVINTQVITTKVINTKVIVTKAINPQVIICPIVCGNFAFFGCYGLEVPVVPVQYERWLRLHNDTNEKQTVFLRYHTEDVTGQWDWIPEEPSPTATKWLAFELQPGEILEPRFNNLPIAANKIRIYTESATRSRVTYRDEDFWLVPEVTPEREHLYYSDVRQTFDFYLGGTK